MADYAGFCRLFAGILASIPQLGSRAESCRHGYRPVEVRPISEPAERRVFARQVRRKIRRFGNRLKIKPFIFSVIKSPVQRNSRNQKGFLRLLRKNSTGFSTGSGDKSDFPCNDAGLGPLREKIHQVCVVTFDVIRYIHKGASRNA